MLDIYDFLRVVVWYADREPAVPLDVFEASLYLESPPRWNRAVPGHAAPLSAPTLDNADVIIGILAQLRPQRCGLEVVAGRGRMGNAVYRDLVQARIMVRVDHLVLAVANSYKYRSKNIGRTIVSSDYRHAVAVADALYGHSRMRMPYVLTIIGY